MMVASPSLLSLSPLEGEGFFLSLHYLAIKHLEGGKERGGRSIQTIFTREGR